MRRPSWLRSLLQRQPKSPHVKRPSRVWRLEELESRLAPTVTTSVASNVLTVNLGAASDSAFITTSANGIRVGTTANAFDIRSDTTGIVAIVVADSGSFATQQVSFDSSDSSSFTLSGASGSNGLSVTGIETVSFTTPVNASGGNIAVSGAATALNINTAAITSSGTQTYSNNVTLGASTNLSAGGGGVGLLAVNVGANTLTISGTGAASTISGIVSGTGGGVTMAGSGKVTLSAGNSYTGATTVSSGTLQVGAGGASGTLASSSAISIANNAIFRWDKSNGTTLETIANAISGAGTFYLKGYNSSSALSSGLYTLSGNNTNFTGILQLDGSCAWNNTLQTQLGGATIQVGANAQIAFNGGTFNNNVVVGDLSGWHNNISSSDVVIGAIRLENTNTLSGNITLNNTTSVVSADNTGKYSAIGAYGTTTATLSGVISGAGDFSMSRYTSYNGGTSATVNITLSGTSSNTYTGKTILNGQGAVANLILAKTGGAVAIPANTTVQMGNTTGGQANLRMGGNSQFGAGVVMNFVNASGQWMRFDLKGTSQSLDGIIGGALTTQSGAVIQNQGIDNLDPGANATLTLTGTGTYLFNGIVRDQDNGGATRKLALTKNAAGSQTLAGGAITYTAATTVSGGTLVLANNTSFNSAITNTATVEFNATTGGTYTTGTNLSGNGIWNKTGTGVTQFNGTQTIAYTGQFNILAGKLQNNNNAVNWSTNLGDMFVDANGTLDLFADPVYVNKLTGTGTVTNTFGNTSGFSGATTATEKLVVGTNGGSFTFDGIITDSGVAGSGVNQGRLELEKRGAGSFTLTNANTFKGNASITAGALVLTNALALQGASVSGGAGLIFDSSVVSHAFTFGNLTGSGAIALADNATTPNPIALTIGGNNNATNTYSGVLSGAGSLTKVGTGITILTGPNTYTGNTTINAGVLGAGGAETAGVSGPFGAQAANAVGTILMTGGALQYSTNNHFDYDGRFNTAGNQSIIIDTNGQDVTLTTPIQGTLTSLTKLGLGTLTIAAANTYTGNTTIAAGTLNAGSAENAGVSGPLGAQAANEALTINMNGGTLQYSAANQFDYSGRFSGFSGQIFNIDTNGQSVNFGTSLSGTGNTLTKLGAGTLTLAAAGNFTGPTTINAGVLALGVANALPTAGSVTVSGLGAGVTATLDLAGFNQSLAALTLGGSTATSGAVVTNTTGSSVLTLTGGATALTYLATNNPLPATISTTTIDLNGVNETITINDSTTTVKELTISANIQNGSLTKAGAGALILSGANTYAGATTVSAGILEFAKQASLYNNVAANWGNLTVASGAIAGLFIGGTNEFTIVDVQTLLALSTGGAGFAPNASLGLDTTTSSPFTYASILGDTANGSLGLAKLGTGTLVLSGLNTYTGTTTIVSGLISLGSAETPGVSGPLGKQAATAAGTIVMLSGGGLQYTSSNNADYSGRFSSAANQTYSIDTNGQNITWASSLSSTTGSLTKSGSGTLTLAGVNIYSGATTVNAGTIKLQTPTVALPSSIASNVLWVDATDLNGNSTNPTNGTQISTWVNKSTGGNFTRTSSSSNPYYFSAGNTMNGLPVVHFVGGVLTNAFNFSTANVVTVMYVGRTTGGANARLLSANNNWLLGYYSGTYNADYWVAGGVTAGTPINYNTHLFAGMSTGAGGAAFAYNIDGPEVQYDTRTSFTAPNSLVMGGYGNNGTPSEGTFGDIGELIAFTTALSPAQRLQMEQYLQAKWNGVLPSNSAIVLAGSGATLDLNGVNQTVGSISGVVGSEIKLGGASLTTGNDATNTTFSGTITGTGNVTKTGAGTQTLAGSAPNTFTGLTVMNQGGLVLSKDAGIAAIPGNLQINNNLSASVWATNDNQFSSSAVVSFSNEISSGANGWFMLNGTTQTIGGLQETDAFRLGVVENAQTGVPLAPVNTGTGTLILAGSGNYSFNGYLRDLTAPAKLAVVKTGSGTQTFSGDRISYTGPTTLSNGTLTLFGASGYASATSVATGTMIKLDGSANWGMGAGGTFNMATGSTMEYATSNGAGASYTTLAGAVTVAGITTFNLTAATNTQGGLFFDGGLKGTGTATINATNARIGAQFRNNNSTFAGTLIVNGIASATVNLGSGIGVGGATTALQNADIQLNGTMELLTQGNGWANTASGAFKMGALSGTGVMVGNYTSGGGTTVTLGNTNNDGVFSGTIANGAGNTVNIIKVGTGIQTLSGTNAYTGSLTVNLGTLTATGGSAIGDTSAITIANVAGATLDVTTSETVGSLAGAGTTGGNIILESGVTLTIGGNNTNTIWAGVISGPGAIIKTGNSSSVQYFDGANTYDGLTTVSGGYLVARNNAALGSTVNGTIVQSGGSLQLEKLTTDVSITGETLSITGTGVSGTRGPLASWAGDNAFTGQITMTGSSLINVNAGSLKLTGGIVENPAGAALTKSGVGILTLTGASTYTGATSITAGALVFGARASLYTDNAANWTVPNITVAASSYLGLGVGDHANGYFDNADIATLLDATHLGASTPTTGIKTAGNLAFDTTNATGGLFVMSTPITNPGTALTVGLEKLGSGTLSLTGSNTYNGQTNVVAGALQVDTGGSITTTGQIVVGGTTTPTLSITGGTLITSYNSGNALYVGGTSGLPGAVTMSSGVMTFSGAATNITFGDNAMGTYTQTGGAFTMSGSGGTWISNNPGSTNSQISVSGGTFSSASTLIDGVRATSTLSVSGTGTVSIGGGGLWSGHNGGSGTFTSTISISGSGTLSMTAGDLVLGQLGSVTSQFTQTGGTFNFSSAGGLYLSNNGGPTTVDLSGGSFSATTGITYLGVRGTATLNVNGTAAVTLPTIQFGNSASAAGTKTVNLNGGTLTVGSMVKVNGTTALNFNGGTLKPKADTNNFITGLDALNVRNGGAVIDTNGFSVFLSQPLIHSTINGDNATDGGLTVNGNGKLTLTAANLYSGPTLINSGTLRLGGASTLDTTNATVRLDASGLSAGAKTTWSNLITSGGAGDFTGNGTVQSGGTSFNNLNVMHFTGASTQVFTNSLSYSNETILYVGALDGTNNKRLVGGTTGNNWLMGYWGGNQDTAYDGAFIGPSGAATTTTRQYTLTRSSASALSFYKNGSLLGTGTGAALNGLSIGGAYGASEYSAGSVGELLVFNTVLSDAARIDAESYLLRKWFAALTTNILPTGTAVTVANSGATFDVNGVTQTIGSLSGVASSAVILGSGSLTAGNGVSTAYDGVISGSGSFTKVGSGTLSLTGSNTYTGGTTIGGGILAVNNTVPSSSGTGTGPINATAGTLGGVGTIAGATTISASGKLAPGNSIGTLTVGNSVALSGDSTMEVNAATAAHDLLSAGALTYGGNLKISNVAGALAAGQSWDLFDFTSESGAFANDAAFNDVVGYSGSDLPTLTGTTLKYHFDYTTGVLSVVEGNPATQLIVTSGTASNTTYGTSVTFTVEAHNASNVLTPNYTGAITISVAGSSFVNSTVATLNAVNGAASFTLYLAPGATVSLTAAASGLTSANSNTFAVAMKDLFVTGATVDPTKVYDGTTSVVAYVNTPGLTGLVYGDSVDFDYGASNPMFAFNDANVGVNKPITVTGYVLASAGSAPASYYNLVQSNGLVSNITPGITSLTPSSGPAGGTTSVTITGVGFTGASSVSFGANPATSFTMISGSQITAVAPAGTGTVDVAVTNNGAVSPTAGSSDNYTYISTPAPTVTSVTPFIGPTSGGVTVIITGTNFSSIDPGHAASAVAFGGTNATSYTVNSSSQITAVAPAQGAKPNLINVVVTNPGGSSSTAGPSDDYTYATPSVTSVVINGGAVSAKNIYGQTLSLAGQQSVVEQIQVTFNERVQLDTNGDGTSQAFSIASLAASVTASVAIPATASVGVFAAPVLSTGTATDGYTSYILTFAAGGSVNSFNNSTNGNLGTAFTALKDGLFQLNTIGAHVKSGVSDTGADRSDKFWALYGAVNAADVTAPSPVTLGGNKLLVDGVALGEMYAAFGSFANVAGPPAYNTPYDSNLDGIIDGVDLGKMYANFGTIWQF